MGEADEDGAGEGESRRRDDRQGRGQRRKERGRRDQRRDRREDGKRASQQAVLDGVAVDGDAAEQLAAAQLGHPIAREVQRPGEEARP
jgi:hypothetical protein